MLGILPIFVNRLTCLNILRFSGVWNYEAGLMAASKASTNGKSSL